MGQKQLAPTLCQQIKRPLQSGYMLHVRSKVSANFGAGLMRRTASGLKVVHAGFYVWQMMMTLPPLPTTITIIYHHHRPSSSSIIISTSYAIASLTIPKSALQSSCTQRRGCMRACCAQESSDDPHPLICKQSTLGRSDGHPALR